MWHAHLGAHLPLTHARFFPSFHQTDEQIVVRLLVRTQLSGPVSARNADPEKPVRPEASDLLKPKQQQEQKS